MTKPTQKTPSIPLKEADRRLKETDKCDIAPARRFTADLRTLLTSGEASTQEAICLALQARGHVVNQSKVSRELRKIGAVKTKNKQGQVVYSLPWEPAPPRVMDTIAQLVLDIEANEQVAMVLTSPGAAQVVARIIDHHRDELNTLGSIAGDDSVLVIPKRIKDIDLVVKRLQALLFLS